MTGIGICMFAPFVGVVGGTSIVQRLRAGAIARRDLRPDDWQDIWPEMDGAQAIVDAQNQPQAPASQSLAATENVAVEVAHG